MNTFLRIFIAELYKVKNTFAVVLLLLIASSIPIFVTFEYLSHSDKFLVALGANPWNTGWKRTITGISIFAAPCGIIMISALLMNTEHKNNSWKYLLTLPVPAGYIYWSKLLVNLFLIVLFYLVFMLVFLLCGQLAGFLFPASNLLNYTPEYLPLFQLFLRSFVAMMALFSIHFWISFRVRNMFINMAFGLMLIFFAMATYQPMENINYFPYNFGELTVFKKHTGPLLLATHEIVSLLIFGCVSGLGYLDFSRKFRG